MKQNYFEFFQLPVQYELDVNNLAERHKAIVNKVHPDRYASASAAEQRMALQWSTFANEAFDTLRDPISRAQYLLTLNAPELTGEETRVSLPQNFLMQQMEWREALEDGKIEAVRSEAHSAYINALVDLGKVCVAKDWHAVQISIAQSQFMANFLQQLPD